MTKMVIFRKQGTKNFSKFKKFYKINFITKKYAYLMNFEDELSV